VGRPHPGKLWQPLGLTSGGFGAPGTPGQIDQPWGHWGMALTGHPVAPGGFVSRLNPPEFFGPAATVRMTVSDWAKFVSIHLRSDPINPNHSATLLKSDSFAVLHQTAPGKLYESGWILSNNTWAHGHRPGDTGRVLVSEGDNGFWHCNAWLAPEIDFAVLILINQGNAAGPTRAGLGVHDAFMTLVQQFAPKPAKPNGTRLNHHSLRLMENLHPPTPHACSHQTRLSSNRT
jgi:CubicO group peptidase (beta-lactamase class C family)